MLIAEIRMLSATCGMRIILKNLENCLTPSDTYIHRPNIKLCLPP